MGLEQYSPTSFRMMPPVVKNLIIINVLFFVGCSLLSYASTIDPYRYLALYYFKSDNFFPYQFITHMFMHARLMQGGLGHIFFNMFALWMFGIVLEQIWGGKKFLFFYIVCGLGAALVQTAVMYFQELYYTSVLSPEQIKLIVDQGYSILQRDLNYSDKTMGGYNILYHISYNIPMVGASGAIFGVLMGFGMMFPNVQLYLIFPPIPIKGKYAAIVALVFGFFIDRSIGQGNVAHFAHLGGMLFGLIIILIWRRQNKKKQFHE